MKPITNILLVCVLISYLFLPIFNIPFEQNWTGIKYTAETISNSTDWIKILFSLLPFIGCFAAIIFNYHKNRYWGIGASISILVALYFYIETHNFVNIEMPEFFPFIGLAYGFKIGYVLLVASLVSAVISIFPFSFNIIKDHSHFCRRNRKASPPKED